MYISSQFRLPQVINNCINTNRMDLFAQSVLTEIILLRLLGRRNHQLKCSSDKIFLIRIGILHSNLFDFIGEISTVISKSGLNLWRESNSFRFPFMEYWDTQQMKNDLRKKYLIH